MRRTSVLDPMRSPDTACSSAARKAQADVINDHALEASGGRTYAEIPQDDDTRETVMTASFLRASLFTSVVSFGVAVMAVGLGVACLLVAWALFAVARGLPGVTAAPATPSSGSAMSGP